MAPPAPPAVVPRRAGRRWDALAGAGVGVLCGMLVAELSFAGEGTSRVLVLVAMLACAAGARTRLRRVVWTAGGLAAATVLVVAFTPLVPWLLAGPPPADPLVPADAVVSLGAGVFSDGTLSSNSNDRVTRAMEVLHAGYAGTLVLPVGGGESWAPTVRRRMAALGLAYRVEEAGPVATTHDEALAVARLARDRGWGRVILVTNAWHMPRAAATFERAGLRVVRAPCVDSRCDMVRPGGISDRLRALSCWIHEAVGMRVYRYRGWA